MNRININIIFKTGLIIDTAYFKEVTV